METMGTDHDGSLKKKKNNNNTVINETRTFLMKSSVLPAGQHTETVGQEVKAASQTGSQML